MITKFLHWLRWQRFPALEGNISSSQGKKVEIYSYRPVVCSGLSICLRCNI